jgi:PTS system mannose-specific IIB component
MKIMLLFASPQDVVEVVELGVDLKAVNIGGMRFSEGKKMITNFISIDNDDVRCFLELSEAGIELEIRQVPTDRKTDLMQLIKKEKMLQ